MSKHFTCPLVAQRFEGTFHVFALAKTFHFSAERRAAQTLTLYLPKNFTFCARVHGFEFYLLCPCAGHQGAASRCRLRCAPCKAVALLKVRSPKSAIFGGGKYTIVFLRRGFPSFCGIVSRSRTILTRKNSPFPPSFARGACSFGKCARRILEVSLGKSAILPRLILSKKQKGKEQVRHKPRLPFRFLLV